MIPCTVHAAVSLTIWLVWTLGGLHLLKRIPPRGQKEGYYGNFCDLMWGTFRLLIFHNFVSRWVGQHSPLDTFRLHTFTLGFQIFRGIAATGRKRVKSVKI